jgi:hypothetical protein
MVTWYTEIWSRYLVKQLDNNIRLNLHRYVWYQMDFFALENASGATRVLCFDAPERFHVRLLEALSSNSQKFDKLGIYQMHTYLADQTLTLYDESVWTLRDFVREVERVGVFRAQHMSCGSQTARIDLNRIGSSRTFLCFMISPDMRFTSPKPLT